MGLFGGDKGLERQLSHQQALQEEQVDAQIASIPITDDKIALDPQVSAMLLQSNERMLTWVVNKNRTGMVKCDKHSDLIEPKMEETTAFLPDEQRSNGLINELDAFLTDLLEYMDRYGYDENSSCLFNKASRIRRSIVGNTRLHGQLAKLSKSQLVSSSAKIQRFAEDKSKKGLLSGLL